jgi:hypothetical protein
MKKYLIIATVAIISLPLISCDKPTGDPKKDIENLKGLAEKAMDTQIKQMEQQLEFAEFYAEDGDYKGYEKFGKKLDKLESAIRKDFKKEHKAEFKDAEKRIEKAEKKLNKSRDKDEENEE